MSSNCKTEGRSQTASKAPNSSISFVDEVDDRLIKNADLHNLGSPSEEESASIGPSTTLELFYSITEFGR